MSEISAAVLRLAKELLTSDMISRGSRHIYQAAVIENSIINRTPIWSGGKNG